MYDYAVDQHGMKKKRRLHRDVPLYISQKPMQAWLTFQKDLIFSSNPPVSSSVRFRHINRCIYILMSSSPPLLFFFSFLFVSISLVARN